MVVELVPLAAGKPARACRPGRWCGTTARGPAATARRGSACARPATELAPPSKGGHGPSSGWPWGLAIRAS